MGILGILPFAVITGFAVVRIYLWLRRGGFEPEWMRVFTIMTAAGILLGSWLSFYSHYTISNHRLEGFPIPIAISTREKPTDDWNRAPLPPVVMIGAVVTNLLCTAAICLGPVALAAFIKQNRGRQDLIGGPPTV